MAWSRNALNLISALHSTSGLGVRPAWYSRRNSAKTRSLYSAAKFTCSISMPITSATAPASTKSSLEEQYSLSSSSSQFFMKMPTTSQPWVLSRCAVTAESTPPLRPTTTLGLRFICAIIPGRPQPHASSAHPSIAAAPAHVPHCDGDGGGDSRGAALAAAPAFAAAAGDPVRGLSVRQAGQPRRAAGQQPRHYRGAPGRAWALGERPGVFQDAGVQRAAGNHHAIARYPAA